MIAKVIKGKGFRGALDYALSKDKAEFLATNMAGKTPRQFASEFGVIRKLRPKLGRAVAHSVISIAPDESLNREQWKCVAESYLEHMGFSNSQYVVVQHNDTEHDHIHIIANRVSMDGAVVSESNDYKRHEEIMRKLEKQYGLQQVVSSEKAMKRAPKKQEIEFALRTGTLPVKQQLQHVLDEALKHTKEFSELCTNLAHQGVGVLLNKAKTGRVSGISFEYDDVVMKGSSLGRGYSWNGLLKRGVCYEQNRSNEIDGVGQSQRVQRGPQGDDSRGRTAEGRHRGAAGSHRQIRALQGLKLWRDNGSLEAFADVDRSGGEEGRKVRKHGKGLSR